MFTVECDCSFTLTPYGHRDNCSSRYAEEGASAFRKTCECEGRRSVSADAR